MPQQVVELLACRSQFGSLCNIDVWKMILLCLMWYIWRECNARNFEDCERMVKEIKAIMLKSLYVWMTAYNCSHFSKFLKFLDVLFFFFFIERFSCILPAYMGCLLKIIIIIIINK
jgi:hypothetical protein